jgi:hypothetical protein
MRESRRGPSSAALTDSADDEGVVTFDAADDRRDTKAGSNLPPARSPIGIEGDGMDVAYLSTLSALAGSVVGGLTSGVATWLSQRTQARESQLAGEMARRDDLYKEFIVAASKAYGEAIVSNAANVQELVALYAMISRMRVRSPPQTVAAPRTSCGRQSTPTLPPARPSANCMNWRRADPESICSRILAK